MSHLLATNYEHCKNWCAFHPNLSNLNEANVFVVNKNRTYILALVSPPSKVVKVFQSADGTIGEIQVEELFEHIQTEAICWCEI